MFTPSASRLSQLTVRATHRTAAGSFRPCLSPLQPLVRRSYVSPGSASPSGSTPPPKTSAHVSPQNGEESNFKAPLEKPYAGRPASSSELIGVFNWKAAGLFVAAGVGLYVYFTGEKERIQELKRQQHAKSVKTGKPLIGGPFSLLDHNGNVFTEKNLLGQWSLMYFGFTNCPDICPEELDKMSEVVDIVDKKHGKISRPVFISCDPARDDVPTVKAYVADFHPRTVGLTGPFDAVKAMCKAFRVYFSTPPTAGPDDDYLVDHSIYFYLMDPDGAFVDAFGKDHTAEQVVEKIDEALADWNEHQRLASKLASE
ncbi:probable sco1-involved in stabilization of cox1p and cox2p [Phaffia rhodozyma]|uniref:Probable sco1-involved in stabilization of cox1p and cox2p n=1 Tax=Phaffia rhodozyma TaxID=264483 RepID=A0A0F7SLH0_PHARH|nr:probable sco1-involved in stabilization of cox1p and cox2p [Phaffia rhodozyma]